MKLRSKTSNTISAKLHFKKTNKQKSNYKICGICKRPDPGEYGASVYVYLWCVVCQQQTDHQGQTLHLSSIHRMRIIYIMKLQTTY